MTVGATITWVGMDEPKPKGPKAAKPRHRRRAIVRPRPARLASVRICQGLFAAGSDGSAVP
jgi:hypothetical protein